MKKNPNIEKIVQKRYTYSLNFEQEEAQALNLVDCTHYEVSKTQDGNILIKPFKKIDIDLDQFPTSTLQALIVKSIEDQIPVDEIFRNALVSLCKERKVKDNTQ